MCGIPQRLLWSCAQVCRFGMLEVGICLYLFIYLFIFLINALCLRVNLDLSALTAFGFYGGGKVGWDVCALCLVSPRFNSAHHAPLSPQFIFQTLFISYTDVSAFLIFQTNSHVSIAACQFWFYASYIIKWLQRSSTDGLLHFSHGRGISLLYVCVCWRGYKRADVCMHMFASYHKWLLVMSEWRGAGTKKTMFWLRRCWEGRPQVAWLQIRLSHFSSLCFTTSRSEGTFGYQCVPHFFVCFWSEYSFLTSRLKLHDN